MAIVWADVVAVAPELASSPAATQAVFITYVNATIDDETWGDVQSANLGRAYYAAHLATVARRRGLGPTTSEAVGQLSRSYGLTGVKGALGMTSYGATYEMLARQLPTVLGLVP